MNRIGYLFGSLIITAVVLLAQAAATSAQGLLLNEVEFDAPSSTNEACQYVEIRGTPGAVVPAGVQFLSVNGASASFGDIQQPVNLAGTLVGPNGTITIINDLELCSGRTWPAGTTQVFTTSFAGLGLDAETYMIVSSPVTFVEGADIDLNNDRVIDPAAQITLIDGFGLTVNSDFQATYAPNVYNAATQGDGSIELPDAATRFSNNNTPLSAAAWYFGEMASTPDNSTVYEGSPRSANFPAGGALTPGGPNVPVLAAPADAVVDFNGDGKTDYSVTRVEGGQMTWYNLINGSGPSPFFAWGAAGDIPVAEDFDGDSKDDIAIWRPGDASAAGYYIFQSSTNTVRVLSFGLTGDDPAVASDWDGDGIADPAIYRDFGGQGGFWYRGSSNNPSGNFSFIQWGTTGDRGLRGDFDGDAKADAAIFRPSTQTWWIRLSSNGQFFAKPFGLASDIRVPGDFDGDAKTDVAVFRDGTWIIERSSNGQVNFLQWGAPGDTPVVGDYNGDGSADLAIWRSGTFYILQSGGSTAFVPWGVSTDLPVASVFNN